MRIERLTDDVGGKRWDAWVAPRARTVTDLYAWSVIVRETYGVDSYLLVAVDDQDHIQGALALYEVRHRLLGHFLLTAPFANDGGLHFDTVEARDALIEECRRICTERRASHVVIRARDDVPGLINDHRYQSAVVNLQGGASALWSRLPSTTRNQVRRGQKEGFSIQVGPDQIEPFHRVFHTHMRELGTPAHALRYYRSIAQHLGEERARFIVVRDGSELVAGALLFVVNDTAANIHTVSLRAYNRRCPNYLLYWHMLETSCQAGCTRFDMGRSVEGSSNVRFKENWKPEIAPLSYGHYLRTLRDVPFADPRNPRYSIPIEVWKRLPLVVTRSVGPHLITGLA